MFTPPIYSGRQRALEPKQMIKNKQKTQDTTETEQNANWPSNTTTMKIQNPKQYDTSVTLTSIFRVSSFQFTVDSSQFKVSSFQITVYRVQLTVYSLQFTIHIVQFTVSSFQFPIYCLPFTVCSLQFPGSNCQFTLHFTAYSF